MPNIGKIVGMLATMVGPAIVRYLKDHPEIWSTVRDAVSELWLNRSGSPRAMRKTITLLREKVDYLRDSADDESEARRAEMWSRHLNNLDHVVELLDDNASRQELKEFHAQLKALRREILAAFILEKGEDAGSQALDQ